MRSCCGRWISGAVLPVVMLALGGWLAAAEGPHRPKGKAEKAVKKEADAVSENQYWIGIALMPADTLLKTHLKIDAGVVVQHVVPDSPAAKAGIKENDLVLKFGNAKASDPAELAKAVNENQDRPAKVTLLREGQEMVVEVTPVRRPAESTLPDLGGDATKWGEEMMREVEKWTQKGKIGEGSSKMFFFRPGVALPEGWQGVHHFPRLKTTLFLQMPKNMSVTVSKGDEGPAKIAVRQGDKTWEVQDNELDKLPDEVRTVVQGLLGSGFPGGLSINVVEEDGKSGAEGKAEFKAGKAANPAQKELDSALKKLDGVRRDMQENQKRLQQEMEKLRQQLDELKK